MRDAVIDRQSLYRSSNLNRSFLNLICHLDNTSLPCGPFWISRFYVRDWVCNQNALFIRLIGNTGHRSTEIITAQLCIFNKNCHRTSAVVTHDERHPSIMPQNPMTAWSRVVTWPIKNTISLLLQSQWPQNLAG